jgi:tRNA G37 N-methylase Trm5
MNLPSLAATFLPAFIGLLHDETTSHKQHSVGFKLYVHVYTFTKNADDCLERAREIVCEQFPASVASKFEFVDTHHVRTVASLKEMICVSFVLPLNVLTMNKCDDAEVGVIHSSDEPAEKRMKL